MPRTVKMAGAVLNVALMVMLGSLLTGFSLAATRDSVVAWILGCLPAFVFWWTGKEPVCR